MGRMTFDQLTAVKVALMKIIRELRRRVKEIEQEQKEIVLKARVDD